MAGATLPACECSTRGLAPIPDEWRDGDLAVCRRCGELLPTPGLADVQRFCSDLADRLAAVEAAVSEGEGRGRP